MDKRLSDVDDHFIIVMKTKRESCSRLGLKPIQTIVDGVFFVYALTNTNIAGIIFFKDPLFFGVYDYGHFVR